MNWIWNAPFVISIRCSDVIVSYLESRVHMKLSDLPSTFKVIFLVSGITIGLTFKLCGATGVITKLLESGKIIGPPQLSE